jgi:hypothetical protein
VNADALFRTAAVVAALALVGAPYWQVAAQAGISIARAAYEAAKARRQGIARTAAAGLLIAAAWGKVPLPSFSGLTVPRISVDTPSDAMQQIVAPIAEALRSAPMSDRMLWGALWSKSALVVAGDAVSPEVVLSDTRALRLFTVLALDIGWRRIGEHAPGEYQGLRDATESAFAKVLGTAEVPVSKDLRARYVELCKAIAWAGVGEG